MADHRLLAIPVIDKASVMCCIVTIDDALQAVREGASREVRNSEAWMLSTRRISTPVCAPCCARGPDGCRCSFWANC